VTTFPGGVLLDEKLASFFLCRISMKRVILQYDEIANPRVLRKNWDFFRETLGVFGRTPYFCTRNREATLTNKIAAII
jgi:hypothetical protein